LKETVAYLAKTVPKSERDLPAVTTAAAVTMMVSAFGHSVSRGAFAILALHWRLVHVNRSDTDYRVGR